ncbi:MAG: hypothetical protein RR216_06230 [Pseudoflavonifractor sp.]
MTNIIVTGHGGYAAAVKGNLSMLTGRTENMTFVDFNPGEDLDTLIAHLTEASQACGDGELLFCSDLTGGSPFRQSAVLCAGHPGWITVAGINAAAYAEMVFNLDKSAEELAEMAISVTKMTVARFPKE